MALPGRRVAAQQSPLLLVDSLQRLIERGTRERSVSLLDAAIALSERPAPDDSIRSVLTHYRGYALYRKGTLFLSLQRKREAKAALDSAESSLDRVNGVLDWPENAALLGAVIGLKIGLSGNPFTAIRNGPRSNRELDRAARMGPSNPRVFLLRGIGTLYKPRAFGGGPDKAASELEHAIELFRVDAPGAPRPSWGRDEAFVFLGIARARQGRTAEARIAYQRALEVDPGNRLVRDSLLPALPSAPR